MEGGKAFIRINECLLGLVGVLFRGVIFAPKDEVNQQDVSSLGLTAV